MTNKLDDIGARSSLHQLIPEVLRLSLSEDEHVLLHGGFLGLVDM